MAKTISEFINSRCKNLLEAVGHSEEKLKEIVRDLTGEENLEIPIGEYQDLFLDLNEKLEGAKDEDQESVIRSYIEENKVVKGKGKGKSQKTKITVKEKEEKGAEEEKKPKSRKKTKKETAPPEIGAEEKPPAKEIKVKREKKKKEEKPEEVPSTEKEEILTTGKVGRARKKVLDSGEKQSKPPELQLLSEEKVKTDTIAGASPHLVQEKKTEVKSEQKVSRVAEIIREETSETLTQQLSPTPFEKSPVTKDESKQSTLGIGIGTAAEQEEPEAVVILQDGTRARVGDADFDEKIRKAQFGVEDEMTESVDKYSGYKEVEDREQKRFSKHTILPDPEVVERVRRESEERLKKKKEKKKLKGKVKPKGSGSVVERIDKEKLFQGRGEFSKVKWEKKEKKRHKFEKYDYYEEDDLQREAEEAVRAFEALGPGIHARRKKKKRERGSVEEVTEKVEAPVIEVTGAMTIESLAQIMDVPSADLIVDLMDLNIMATKNQVVDIDAIKFLAQKHGYEVRLVIPEEEDILKEEPDNPEDLIPRPPVVTVMGHVDHGKTSLLDKVRSTNVAASEAGGITQHIAAYEVNTPSGKVVFLDTPGHEAFTQMRARGAKVTDIVVLVVAADDGVQPQTIEAIDHARSAEVPIIVAINKCDKPDAQPDKVRQQLAAYGLIDEAWGGKTIMKNISARTGEGVNELLELIVLQSQMMDLKANPNRKARGTVIEAEISRYLGPVAWVLVQNGTLRVGDVVLVGDTWGKVRAMYNSNGESIKDALPSIPVLITGLENLPEAGDKLIALDDERKAKVISEKRKELKRFQSKESLKPLTLEDLQNLISAGEVKKLPIIIKADVQGSADVLKTSLGAVGNEEVTVDIIRAGVGEVSESDVLLAQVTKAIIISFNVEVHPRAQKLAEEKGVEVRKYCVIYDVLEDIRKALSGLLKPVTQEIVLGRAEIRKVFRSSSIGNIAGCFQLDGLTVRGAHARVIRNGVVVAEDRIISLKRLKDDVKEVSAGYECGIKLEKFEDIEEGDIIETYKLEEVKPSLN
ncbi:MAG: translation initiation factor IF-2 [Candidatus Hydrogenedentes bacterium]|nr:translation initiation factor IF-2 [Candidatus Hydrogenedentota bacterium]